MKRKPTKTQKIRFIYSLLDVFFKGNFRKTDKWLRTKNHLLGNLRPWDMIEAGREDKLLKFIKDRLEENEGIK